MWDRCVADGRAAFDRLNLTYLRALRHAQRQFGDAVPESPRAQALAPSAYAMVVLLSGRFHDLPPARRTRLFALGNRWRILVVESPNGSRGALRAQLTEAGPNLFVMTPWIPVEDGDADDDRVASV